MTLLVAGAHAGTRSDALSKPLFIDGMDALPAHAKKLGVTAWLAVDTAGQLHVSPAMQARLR